LPGKDFNEGAADITQAEAKGTITQAEATGTDPKAEVDASLQTRL